MTSAGNVYVYTFSALLFVCFYTFSALLFVCFYTFSALVRVCLSLPGTLLSCFRGYVQW